MKCLKYKLKIILVIIASTIFVSGLSVYATYNYLAKDISYIKSDGTKISVENALNELYKNKSDEITYNIGTNNSSNGIETIQIERDNKNAIIISGQCTFRYSINSSDDFKELTSLGETRDGVGFYYSYISLKKGDTVYIKRDTIGEFAYAIIY